MLTRGQKAQLTPGVDGLNAEQFKNFKSFIKKSSAGAESLIIARLSDGIVDFSYKVPGRVPGSYAIYRKRVGPDGVTIRTDKFTVTPSGEYAHIKPK